MDTSNKHCTSTTNTSDDADTQTPPMTERDALYRCITSMWEYALSPLPDDSLLAIIESCREFGEYDHDYLKKWVEEVEASRSSQLQERRDVARLAHVTEVQDHLFFALELAHRFSPNPAVRKRIEDETRAIRDQWNKQAAAPDKKRGYAGMADRAQATCDAYVKLLNELYEMRPSDEIMPNGNTAASIEQYRIDLAAITKQAVREALKSGLTVTEFAGQAEMQLGAIAALTADAKEAVNTQGDRLSDEIGMAKAQSKGRQSGLTKENTELKAQIKALTDNSKTK